MTDQPNRFNRRVALQMGGAVSLAALLAACGKRGGSSAPGRIGVVPAITEPEAIVVDDALLLRTATSVEYTALAVIAKVQELGALDDTETALVEQFVSNHQANADALAQATTAAGGEPYECENQWLMDRTWNAVFEQINGTEGATEATTGPGGSVPDGVVMPTDDAHRDSLYVLGNLESITAASYQQLVTLVADGPTRAQFMTIADTEARQAAAIALRGTGSPEGYLAPALRGETGGGVDAEGFTLQYAVPSQFGSLAPVTFNVGAPGAGGIRRSFTLYTPADNSYITPNMSCDGRGSTTATSGGTATSAATATTSVTETSAATATTSGSPQTTAAATAPEGTTLTSATAPAQSTVASETTGA